MTTWCASEPERDATNDRVAPAGHSPASAASELSWLWAQVRPFVWYQLGSIACIVLGSVVNLAHPLLLKWMLDDVLPQRDVSRLILVTLAVIGIYLGDVGLSVTGRLINVAGVVRLVTRVRMRLLRRLLDLPPAFHARHTAGDLVQRVERDVAVVGEFGSDVLPSLLRAVVQTTLAAVALLLLEWRLALMLLPLLPLFALVQHRYRALLQSCSERLRHSSGGQSGMATELMLAVTQIQLLCAEPRLARRYARENLRTLRRHWETHAAEGRFTLVTSGVIATGTAAVMGYGGWCVIAGTLSAGSLVAFSGLVAQIFVPLRLAADLSTRFYRARASVSRLLEIEHEPDDRADAGHGLPVASRPSRITCDDVTFGYTDGSPALHGIGFEARAGECIALVGPSGGGKSSLVKLMPRLYQPTHGRVAVDGHDVRTLQLRSLRHAISFVPQEPVLFRGTLRENLRFGCPTVTPEDLERGLTLACLNEVVAALPQGLDTMLGPRGDGLSGGEKQRVAIARAILQDRPILILDEATSALDVMTEHRLLTQLKPWCAGRLVIVVSHRLSAPRWADRVVLVRHGRIVVDGTHAALDQPGSYYHEFWARHDSCA